jgi:alpha-tubulin suppressor-like RCC1 family protein
MILVDNELYMWGSNVKGQLGNNTNIDLLTPSRTGLILSSNSVTPWTAASTSAPIKIKFENGMFVGIDGRKSSNTGTSWQNSSVTMSNTPVFGNGTWVAWNYFYSRGLYSETSEVHPYTSPDGINWSQQTSLPYTIDTGSLSIGKPTNSHYLPGVQPISFVNGKFFGFIGTKGKGSPKNVIPLYSTDGDTYDIGTTSGLAYVDQWNGATAYADLCEVRGIANSPPLLGGIGGPTMSIAVGRGLNGNLANSSIKTSKCIRSTDQINWTATTLPFAAMWNGIAYGNGRFVAVCDGADAATSTDGINWVTIKMPSTLNWTDIAFGNGVWVAVGGPSSAVAVSRDGVNWSKVTTLPVSATWSGVAYGNNKFLITSTKGVSLIGDSFTVSSNLRPGDFKYATLGKRHSVGISPAGFMYTWGDNSYGQLGDGTNVDKKIPTKITSVNNGSGVRSAPAWTYVAASNHNLAITKSGALYAWGNNNNGQLSSGVTVTTTTGSPITTTVAPAYLSVPLLIDSGKWHDVDVGNSHSMGLKWDASQANLELYTWGSNQYGQLGDGTNNSSSDLLRVPDPPGSTWAAIACGANHSMALDANGQLYTWGRNNHGQLGDGTIIDKNSPVSPASSIIFNLIDGGGDKSIAIDEFKNLYSWGENSSGELGYNTLVDNKNIVKNTYLENILEVSIGDHHSIALSIDPPKVINNSMWTNASSSAPVRIGFEDGQFTGNDIRMSYDGGFNWQTTDIDFSYAHNFTTPVFGGGTWVTWKHFYVSGSTIYNNAVLTSEISEIRPYTSADGINWSQQTALSYKLNNGYPSISTPSNSHSAAGVQTMSFINGKFFGFIGTRGKGSPKNVKVSYSTNGDTWTQGSVTGLNYVDQWNGETAYADLCEIRGIANSPTMSVAVGRGLSGNLTTSPITTNKCIRSTDQINWAATTLPFAAVWNGVAYGDGRFVAVCDGSRAATSTDGINWTSINMPSTLNWTSVAYGNGKWIAVGGPSSVAATSTNGINWTKITLPISAVWSSVAYGNGDFLIASTTGTSLRGLTSPTTTISPASRAGIAPRVPTGPLPCCPSGAPNTSGETHLHNIGKSWASPLSPVVWDDNVVGPYWMIEWYEVDSNDGVHAWISKREAVCLFPGTNRIDGVVRVGSPKGCTLSATVNKTWKPDISCNPLCTETETGMGLKANFNYNVIKNLKGFGGMHWVNTQYVASLNNISFPTNGIVGPLGAGSSVCGSSCAYRVYDNNYTSALDGFTLGLMNNQPGSMAAEASNVIGNLACLQTRLSGKTCGGQPKINFHLSKEDKKYRESLYPVAATNNRDDDPPCCSADDMVRGSEECGGGEGPTLDPPTECPDTPCACHYTTDGNPDCTMLAPGDLSTCSLIYNGILTCDCSGSCNPDDPPPPDSWWRCMGDGNCCQAGVDDGCEPCNSNDENCYGGYMANSSCNNNCNNETTPPPPTDGWWRCTGDGSCCQAGVDNGCAACNDQDLDCYSGNSAQSDCSRNCDQPTTAPPPPPPPDNCTVENCGGNPCSSPSDKCCGDNAGNCSCCPEITWVCCPNQTYCAASLGDCPP